MEEEQNVPGLPHNNSPDGQVRPPSPDKQAQEDDPSSINRALQHRDADWQEWLEWLDWQGDMAPVTENRDSARLIMETVAKTHQWLSVTVIDDDELTFGGKPLSAWHEENRRRCTKRGMSGHVSSEPGETGNNNGQQATRSTHSGQEGPREPESSAPSPTSSADDEDDEELHRGRSRMRIPYTKPPALKYAASSHRRAADAREQ